MRILIITVNCPTVARIKTTEVRACVRAHVNVFKTVLAEMANLNQEASLKMLYGWQNYITFHFLFYEKKHAKI